MHCANCGGFVTPNISTCTCDPVPGLLRRLDDQLQLIRHLISVTDAQGAMLERQRQTIDTLAARLDQFQQAEDRQDSAQTELDSRLLDIETFYGLAA